MDWDGNGYFKTATSEEAVTCNSQTAADGLHAINNYQTLTLYLMFWQFVVCLSNRAFTRTNVNFRSVSPDMTSMMNWFLEKPALNTLYLRTIKWTRCTNFSNLFFGIKLYTFWTVPLSIIRSFSLYTQQWYMLIQVCWQLASRIRMELQFHPDPARKLSAKLYDIYHCCMYSEKLLMIDRGIVWNM